MNARNTRFSWKNSCVMEKGGNFKPKKFFNRVASFLFWLCFRLQTNKLHWVQFVPQRHMYVSKSNYKWKWWNRNRKLITNLIYRSRQKHESKVLHKTVIPIERNGSLSGHCRPFITKLQKSYDRFKMMKPPRLVQSSRRDPILY